MASVEVRHCPACQSSGSRQVGTPAIAFTEVTGGIEFRHPAYAIRRCDICHLYFKTHTLSPEALTEYYARLEGATFDIDGNFPTDRHLRDILNRLPAGSKVLDFGCSTGRILTNVATRLNCYGVEPNAPAAAIAAARGIRILSEGAVRAGDSGPFDAVLMCDVFEHLARPTEVAEMLAGQLRAGGSLVIVTGNADAVRARDYLAEFWYFRLPGHLIMLSERHLRWLAARLGLQVQALERCSHYRTPWVDCSRQWLRALAYDRFRHHSRGVVAGLLRTIPGLRRVQTWPTAPALTYRADHVVAVLHKDA